MARRGGKRATPPGYQKTYRTAVFKLPVRALRGVFVLVLALALSAPVLAADFEVGWTAYTRAWICGVQNITGNDRRDF